MREALESLYTKGCIEQYGYTIFLAGLIIAPIIAIYRIIRGILCS